MHILLNALSAVAGGSLTYQRNILPHLAGLFADQQEHRLSILMHRTQDELVPETPGIERVILDGPFPRSYRRPLWEIQNLRRNLKGIDVYFLPYQAGHIPRNVRTVMMLRNMEPFMHWHYQYDMEKRLRNIALRRLTLHSMRKADHLIAVSDFARDHLINALGVLKTRINTIHHGCGPIFSPTLAPGDVKTLKKFGITGDYIFTSGSLLPYRRLEDVIAAFQPLAKSHPDIQLVITGSGNDSIYRRKIDESIRAADAGNQIVVPGFVDHATMAALYRNSLAFVTATEIEACPNTIIEALASGCAVVAPNAQPMPEFVGDNGVLFKPRNHAALTGAMQSIVEDGALRARLKAAAAAAGSQYTWQRCAEKTFAVLTHQTA